MVAIHGAHEGIAECVGCRAQASDRNLPVREWKRHEKQEPLWGSQSMGGTSLRLMMRHAASLYAVAGRTRAPERLLERLAPSLTQWMGETHDPGDFTAKVEPLWEQGGLACDVPLCGYCTCARGSALECGCYG